MKQESVKTTKKTAFEICKNILNDSNFEIVSENYRLGEIEVKKGVSLLSYGHGIKIQIKKESNSTTKISVTSKSLGIQILDWGTNSDNETELIDLITQNF